MRVYYVEPKLEHLERVLFGQIKKWGEPHPRLVQFASPVLVPTGLVLKLLKGIACIVEKIFEALGNILGSCFLKDCSMKNAVRALGAASDELLWNMPYACTVGLVSVIGMFLFDPQLQGSSAGRLFVDRHLCSHSFS